MIDGIKMFSVYIENLKVQTVWRLGIRLGLKLVIRLEKGINCMFGYGGPWLWWP